MTRSSVRLLSVLLLSFAASAACDDSGGGSSDGTTSWFGRCSTGRDCTEGLDCLCGVCSRACSAAADCGGTQAPATCVTLAGGAGSSCALSLGTTARSICLPACDALGSCAPGLACSAGICIPSKEGASDAGPAPAGGSTGTGGIAGAGPTAAGGASFGGSASGGGGAGGGVEGYCGDGIATGREACDGLDLRNATCADFGFDGGSLACNPMTCRYDVDPCRSSDPTLCGNGVVDPGEPCDGTNLGGLTCETLGSTAGTLVCTPECRLSAAGCGAPVCGDGVAGRGEPCDGADLRGQSCVDLGYPSGTLSCTKGCLLDETKCKHCGDLRVEQGEECDGAALGGTTCIELGFAGGTPKCDETCKLDGSSCSKCGNGAVEAGESCDGTNLHGASCESLGFDPGTLRCSEKNCLFDLSGCGLTQPKCGNSVSELGEECDGADLRGLDCDALGFEGGTLKCAASCRFDAAECFMPPPPDPCRACREQQCRPDADRCRTEPSCTTLFTCMSACADSPDELCWFHCGDATPEGLQAAIVIFSCMTASCATECGGNR